MKTMIRPFLLVCVVLCTRILGAQTPVFNSLPGAPAVILLDFDGHTVSGTAWNWNGPIQCGPSGLDNASISEIFYRIAEDYRPFEVNVSTDSTAFLAAPLNRRIRIIFTTSHEWYGNSGGVAMLESFTWGDDTPAFVFTALLNYNRKLIGEAGAHETGHTLGLYHQVVYDANCNQISEYNMGQGSGEIGWAPIMGNSYYRNMTVWHNGPNYTGCSSIQDELQLITAPARLSYRNDDHSSNFNQASNIQGNNNQFSMQGVIERNTDEDCFKFNLKNDGQFTLDAMPYSLGQGNLGSNLDMELSLYDRRKKLIGTYNPGTILNAVIDTFLQAGFYYIKVKGEGNAFTSPYASLGSYTLQGSLASASRGESQVQLFRAQENNQHILHWTIETTAEVDKLVLEWSKDGKEFRPLADLPVHAREFIHTPRGEQEWMYRIHVYYRGGAEQYSNKVILKAAGSLTMPRIISNPVNHELKVSSPDLYEYFISDMQGNLQMKGRVTKGSNSIPLPFMSSGLYLIRFVKGAEVYTEKFIRR